MSFTQLNTRLRLGLALLASGAALGLAGTASAQTGYPGAYREDAGSALSRHLKTLSESPRNISALTGAAKAALELGDAQAAVTFYARAEEIAPRDGRIKAGIGSAFLAMEQPDNALRFFEEARGLGAPEGEFAADRGLAYDLLGNPAQAQRDYLLAMRSHDTDELRRRLALSRAISGDRAGALAIIEPQLRRQDRAAWRVRAFVLALTGDAAGATEAVRAVMPQQAAAMQPFLNRLPGLQPAQRAMAVHLGHFPGDGSSQITSQPSYTGASVSLPPAITNAGRPSGSQPALGSYTLNGGPRASVGAPVQSRPSGSSPEPQAVRRAAPAPAPQRQSPPTQVAHNQAGLPAAQPSYPQSRPVLSTDRMRSTRPSARDRVSGIYTRNTTTMSASTTTRTQTAQRPPATPAVGGQQMAALNVRQPVFNPAGQGTASSMVTPPGSAQPALAMVGGSVQGPPSPSGSMPVRQPTVQVAATTVASTPSPSVMTNSGAGPTTTASPGFSSVAVPSTSTSAAGAAPTAAPGLAQVTSAAAPSPSAATTNATLRPITSPVPAPRATASSAAATSASTASAAPAISPTLASVAATIRSLDLELAPSAPADAKAVPAAAKTAPAAAKAAPTVVKPQAEAVTAERAGAKQAAKVPSRHWVQIAGHADKASLKGEFARLKGRAPKLLSDKSAWTAPLRYTNRLLVGPFNSEAEAQGFVNELQKAELAAFSWTSPAGQDIEKLTGK